MITDTVLKVDEPGIGKAEGNLADWVMAIYASLPALQRCDVLNAVHRRREDRQSKEKS